MIANRVERWAGHRLLTAGQPARPPGGRGTGRQWRGSAEPEPLTPRGAHGRTW